MCLRIRDEIFQAFDGKFFRHHEHIGADRRERYGFKVLLRVERKLLVECLRGRKNGRRTEQNCVSIRCRFGHKIGTDCAAGTRSVFDDDSFAPTFAELIGDKPRDEIGAAAGGEGYYDCYSAVRIALWESGCCKG